MSQKPSGPPHPTTGWTFYSLAGVALGVEFGYLRDEAHFNALRAGTAEPDTLHLQMTPEQALELGQRLQALAEQILQRQRSDAPRN